jgi:TfoX/Sxy family transcriptional regulator of competence genes
MPRAPEKQARRTRTKGPAPSSEIDREFAAVIAAFARDKRVTSGKMMASVGLKVNGKIFAMMVRGKFVAKLPKKRVDELVASGAGDYFDPRKDGRLMKEWIVLRAAQPPWLRIAKEAHGFVKGQ